MKMEVLRVLCCVFFLSAVQITKVFAQSPVSACPRIFRYELDNYGWFGVIEAPNPPPYGSEMTIKIRMAIRAQLPTTYVGKIELADDRDTVLQKIAQNWPVKYIVSFPVASPLPAVLTVDFAGRRLCSGNPLYGRFITVIDLQHTLHSGESALKNSPKDKLIIGGPIPTQKPRNNFVNQNPPQQSQQISIDNRNSFADDSGNISFEPEPERNIDNALNNDDICGTTTKHANPLIVSGDSTAKGDWPWMVAIFLKKPRGLEFICAGSLISADKVVTAGHCVKKRNSNRINPEELVLKIGVHNIQDWTEETAVTKSVSSIKTHEEFNIGAILNNDIAVLTLSQNVAFTDYIRPICLWSGDPDLEMVVGKMATVVGWGKDESGVPSTPEPRIATVPIVSTMTCKASRQEFFKLTSDTTLCAGARDGSGPCNGDSGGGLYLRQGDRWALRGIVSKSLKDPETASCDLKEFVVYTDAAKFEDFIR